MANEYIQQTGTANPFNGIDIGDSSTPTLADIDNDGDLDALIGEHAEVSYSPVFDGFGGMDFVFYGILNYYQNTGSKLLVI